MRKKLRANYFIRFILLFFLSSHSEVSANTGVFFGTGNQIIPIKNNDIQLKSESVRFSIKIPSNSEEFGIKNIPIIHAEAAFELINKKNKEVSLQAGFPFFNIPDLDGKREALKKLNFVVESQGKSRRTTLKRGMIEKKLDPDGLFKNVFTWSETFKPNERKLLNVSYDIKMAINAVYGEDIKAKEEGGTVNVGAGIAFSFSYITKTAYTWSPPLEKAIFKADMTPLYEYFKSSEEWQTEETKNIFRGISHPVITLHYGAKVGVEKKDNSLIWDFSKKLPEEIGGAIILQAIPIKLDELKLYLQEKKKHTDEQGYRSLIKHLRKTYQGLDEHLFFDEDKKELLAIEKFLANNA